MLHEVEGRFDPAGNVPLPPVLFEPPLEGAADIVKMANPKYTSRMTD